jgi:beta-lactam-binding protein with PASTA domain
MCLVASLALAVLLTASGCGAAPTTSSSDAAAAATGQHVGMPSVLGMPTDQAIETLERTLKVSASEIKVEMIDAEGAVPLGTIVAQQPAIGEPLDGVQIVIKVASGPGNLPR